MTVSTTVRHRTSRPWLHRLAIPAALAVTLVALPVVAPAAEAASSAPAATSYPYPPTGNNDCDEYGTSGCIVDKWSMYQGQCTSGVAYQLNAVNGVDFTNSYRGAHWGNANNWDNAARSVGIRVDQTPAVGAVAQWESMHVAWVQTVHSNDKITIWEMNFDRHNGVRTRDLTRGQAGWPDNFIHIKDVQTSSGSGSSVNASSYNGRMVRNRDTGAAYLVKSGKRYHVPTGGDYEALRNNGVAVVNLTPTQINQIPDSSSKATVATRDDASIHDPWGYVTHRRDHHGHAGDRSYTWSTHPGGRQYNVATWSMSQAPGVHRIKVFIPHRNANANIVYEVYDGSSRIANVRVRQVDIYGWTTLGTWSFRTTNPRVVLRDNAATARNQVIGYDAAQVVPLR